SRRRDPDSAVPKAVNRRQMRAWGRSRSARLMPCFHTPRIAHGRSLWGATTRILFVGALAHVVASCGGNDYVVPTSPTPSVATPAGTPGFGLSGTISEVTLTGLTPLAGAQVSTLGASATTNEHGFYTLSGLEAGPLVVTASKA